MNLINEATNLKCIFEPYVGECYGKSSVLKRRLLILGASHYCSCPTQNDKCHDGVCSAMQGMTQQAMLHYRQYGKPLTYHRFFQSLGALHPQIDIDDLVRSVSFYNYLQKIEGKTWKDSHPEFYTEESHYDRFQYVLRGLRPDAVIVWGPKVREAIYSRLMNLGAKSHGGYKTNIFTVNFDGNMIDFCFCGHPSAPRFNRERHAKMYEALDLFNN